MEKEQIKRLLDGNLVRAYLYEKDGRKEYIFADTPENIANFLGQHQYDVQRIILTDMFDTLILDFTYGFVNRCPDQKFLKEKLLPLLIPLQMGINEPREVEVATWDDVEAYCCEEEMMEGMEMNSL